MDANVDTIGTNSKVCLLFFFSTTKEHRINNRILVYDLKIKSPRNSCDFRLLCKKKKHDYVTGITYIRTSIKSLLFLLGWAQLRLHHSISNDYIT